jgi:hypothetical protein
LTAEQLAQEREIARRMHGLGIDPDLDTKPDARERDPLASGAQSTRRTRFMRHRNASPERRASGKTPAFGMLQFHKRVILLRRPGGMIDAEVRQHAVKYRGRTSSA